ncbi:tyrosine-protein phosphatase [Lacticaseibacillus jixianensis]|uniref:Tyrosine-protein phosphatase n=1 Tax=Lacticaseibacillus jixianensis TaxID=2486012 RepID=A0ABW4B6F5_9LACO|nr:tyrosine-protein phosphatase [Lacticaseibacillus jixianensis]
MTPIVLDVKHGINLRDLGGYQTKAGQTLRTHRILRSGRLNELSEADLNYLADYGLRQVIDFRSPQERADAPDRVPAGAVDIFNPVFPTDETKVTAAAEEERHTALARDPLAGFRSMVHTYATMVVQPSAKRAYRQFFDALLSAGDTGALLFHCSAGKDRTGMGAVYLLTALGVDPLTIRQDYLASNRYLVEEGQRLVDAVIAEGGSPALQASYRSLGSVANEYLDSALFTINHEYGSLPNYLQTELMLSAAEQRDLRALYLE